MPSFSSRSSRDTRSLAFKLSHYRVERVTLRIHPADREHCAAFYDGNNPSQKFTGLLSCEHNKQKGRTLSPVHGAVHALRLNNNVRRRYALRVTEADEYNRQHQHQDIIEHMKASEKKKLIAVNLAVWAVAILKIGRASCRERV